MRTGASDSSSRGFRGQGGLSARSIFTRKTRLRRAFLESESLESRTLLATIPVATATGAAMNLTNLGSVTSGGNANNPQVVVDPYDSQKLFAVWGVDESTLTPTVPHTTAIVEGAYSNNGGTSWHSLGQLVAEPQLDILTVNANPQQNYTQITNPNVAFDGQGNVYVLSMQSSGAADGGLFLTSFNFSANSPTITNTYTIYQWVGGSDAATTPTLAVDAAPSPAPAGVPTDPHANNVYIAWASIDTEPANTNPFTGIGFNPNRAELVVGTPVANPPGNQQSLGFSAVTTVSTGGNFGSQRNSHPQLVINQNLSGQITVGWDDFGTGATASTPFDILNSNQVTAGDSYGFTGGTGVITAATAIANPPTGSPVVIPGVSTFNDTVNIANPTQIDNLTVGLDLVDFAAVANLQLVLVSPNGLTLTLVANQVDQFGKTNTSQGLPNGNAIGQFGFTTGTNGTPGVVVGTEFDDNATRNIFDANTANPPTNGNTATDYIGYFRPEGESLKSFLSSVGSGHIDGPWQLRITNFAAGSSTSPAFGVLNEFNLVFSTGMTASSQREIDTTLVTGALGNSFPRDTTITPTGIGPGLVLGIDNTLGPDSPHQGRIYAAYVQYFNISDVNLHVNPSTNTDIILAYSDNNGASWVNEGIVNDDSAVSDGYSSSSIGSSARTRAGERNSSPRSPSINRPELWSCRGATPATTPRTPVWQRTSRRAPTAAQLQSTDICQPAADRHQRHHGADHSPGSRGRQPVQWQRPA